MESNGFLKIKEDALRELTEFQAKALVGRVCKRFEILDKKEDIKREAKELIYESYRQLIELVYAYDKGKPITQFNFKKGKSTTII